MTLLTILQNPQRAGARNLPQVLGFPGAIRIYGGGIFTAAFLLFFFLPS